ncbi:MAG: hypothetical protein K2Y05_01630, partial [Hyphomicrobiaceae bacterium]|nr:hypothetical protein [Hyphomicrobiaceae bacterium]
MAAMSRAIDANGGAAAGQGGASLLRPLVLLRLAAGEASRTELVRDLKVFGTVAGQSASAIKATVEAEAEQLVAAGMARKAGSRIAATDTGREHARRVIRPVGDAQLSFAGSWCALRDGPLTLAAIGA